MGELKIEGLNKESIMISSLWSFLDEWFLQLRPAVQNSKRSNLSDRKPDYQRESSIAVSIRRGRKYNLQCEECLRKTVLPRVRIEKTFETPRVIII